MDFNAKSLSRLGTRGIRKGVRNMMPSSCAWSGAQVWKPWLWHTRQCIPALLSSGCSKVLLPVLPVPGWHSVCHLKHCCGVLGNHVSSHRNLFLEHNSASAEHVGSLEWSHGPGILLCLAQGNSHPQSGTGVALLGRTSCSCSSPLRECWYVTPQHSQTWQT